MGVSTRDDEKAQTDAAVSAGRKPRSPDNMTRS
jgi:hypothetical protein